MQSQYHIYKKENLIFVLNSNLHLNYIVKQIIIIKVKLLCLL